MDPEIQPTEVPGAAFFEETLQQNVSDISIQTSGTLAEVFNQTLSSLNGTMVEIAQEGNQSFANGTVIDPTSEGYHPITWPALLTQVWATILDTSLNQTSEMLPDDFPEFTYFDLKLSNRFKIAKTNLSETRKDFVNRKSII